MEYYDEVIEIRNQSERKRSTGAVITTTSPSPPISGTSTISNAILKNSEKLERVPTRPPTQQQKSHGNIVADSDSESSQSDTDENQKKFNDIFGPKQWENLNAPPEIKDIFQYIMRYAPQTIEIDYYLEPFIPDYIPAVGDIDAFLKVIPPKPINSSTQKNREMFDTIKKLGLEVLDEPSDKQSDSTILQMRLRSMSMEPRQSSAPAPIAKSKKDILNWIKEIQSLHANKPFPMLLHSKPLQDIDALMTEWPSEMERILNQIGFPSASLNCSLIFYIELVCGLFDIKIPETRTHIDYLLALFTLFNLFMATKQSKN